MAAAAQDGVPTVQLGGGDAVAGGKSGTDVSGLCRGVFGAVGYNTRLRRPGCRGWARLRSNAIILAGPEFGYTVGAIRPQHGVPCASK